MSQSPTATTSGTEQKRTDAQLPTPDYAVPGVTDLSTYRPGDQIILDGHSSPLTVQFVGLRERSTCVGPTTQYALEATHDRDNAVTHELYEHINVADGEVIEVVDEHGRPTRVYEVPQ